MSLQNVLREAATIARENGVFPGCSIGVIAVGGETYCAVGRETYDEEAPMIHRDSLYDVASLTKVVPTATLALQLIDEGLLRLDDPLTIYVPEYATQYRAQVTIQHLLTYTLGNVTPLSSLSLKSPDEILTAICTEETREPGTIFSYSNTPALLLGLVCERLLGPLEVSAQARIFNPLGMRDTTFTPHDAVPTERGIQDVVHDESARVFSRAHRAAGHAGLFSTAPDMCAFLRSVLEARDERLCTNYLAALNATASLGWELNQPHFMGSHATARTFGKTGFTGTSLVCNYERQVGIVILSNRTYPARPGNASAINAFRRKVCDIVFSI